MAARSRLSGVVALTAVLCLCSCRAPEARTPEVPVGQVEELLARKQQAESLFEQAVGLEGEPERQKGLYVEALKLDPSHGMACNNLGVIYLAEGSYPEAVLWLREAVKRTPSRAEPRFNLGYAYEVIGRLESAEEEYAAAVSLAPEEPDYAEALARVHIRRRDHLDEAEELLKRARAVETRPEHVKWIESQLQALESGYLLPE